MHTSTEGRAHYGHCCKLQSQRHSTNISSVWHSLLTKGIRRDGVEVQESGTGETEGEAGVSGLAYDRSTLEAEAKGSSGPA